MSYIRLSEVVLIQYLAFCQRKLRSVEISKLFLDKSFEIVEFSIEMQRFKTFRASVADIKHFDFSRYHGDKL